jgi:hypothetical protein
VSTVTSQQPSPVRLPFSVWLFARLIVPAGPVFIQYGLKGLGLYEPPFPQPAFVILSFSLALVTVTEYADVRAIIYGCMIPALGASVLYTVYILKIDSPEAHRPALLVGFYLWVVLFSINLTRTSIDALKRYI